MHSLTLDQDNRSELAAGLAEGGWTVACLCAGWCGTCGTYRATFEALAARHPALRFVWIDIEDQADIVGDLDIDNFPTLLIQHDDTVAFFGTVLPDAALAERLLAAQLATSSDDLGRLATSTAERRDWQRLGNLKTLLG
ncbi:thioredoxin family protein [Massilia sp. DWR3-1-1]|uniref:thioredoxin family protein n=1 Tax=Massilia sp. DWR3-1-1 TaxID=2804559 RepID=UPI003CF4F865